MDKGVSDQPRRDSRIRESVELLLFIEQAPVAIAMFDLQMRYVEASQRWRQIYGLNDRKFKGISHYEIFPEIPDIWKAAHRRGLAGEVVTAKEDRFERADGSVQWLHWEIQPWRESSGALGGIIIFIEDITERKHAELSIRESEETFRALSEAMPQMVWASDPTGRANYFNSRWFSYTGQTYEEAKNVGWLNTLHPEDVPRAQERWTFAVTHGQPYEVEYRVRGKDGLYRWFLARGVPKQGETSKIERWIGTCTDISAQKELEQELIRAREAAEEANRAKSEFLANTSHEIRTPMTIFMAVIEHLLQIDKDPKRRELLAMAGASSGRLRNLIEDILDFSRIESKKLEITDNPFDLRSCIREALDMFSLAAREKNLALELKVGPDVPDIVIADSYRLGQVLINLIGNAVKFTHKGEIVVSVCAQDKKLEFSVSDTGIGIPPEKQQILFQSFSQADSSLTRQYGGSGLGLAICKGLVELMGGEISVHSRESEGSVFTFTMPLKFSNRPHPSRKGDGEVTETNSAVRILLGEDDQMICHLISTLLKEHGWQIETARSGTEVVEKWQRGAYDVVLMDIQMPEMDGLQATKIIRIKEEKKIKNGRTIIIALTAHADSKIKQSCLDSGMDDVLTKPVQSKDLFMTIGQHIADR
jgi:PAS domain S-box-containing protein